MRTNTTTGLDDRDVVILFGCLVVGAVIGFSLTGAAAVGTAVGAAVGGAVVATRHRTA